MTTLDSKFLPKVEDILKRRGIIANIKSVKTSTVNYATGDLVESVTTVQPYYSTPEFAVSKDPTRQDEIVSLSKIIVAGKDRPEPQIKQTVIIGDVTKTIIAKVGYPSGDFIAAWELTLES